MSDRLFTLEEAAEALVALRPVAERMVDLRRAQQRSVERLATLRRTIAGNGGSISAGEAAQLSAEVDQLSAAVAACVDRLSADGVQVKDVDSGLLDFPSLRDGREILLCWRVGEERIAYWHGADEGFAGRKPLDSVE